MLIAVIIVLGVWFVLSVLNQLPLKVNTYVRRFDIFHLVPRWTFFAPNPGVTDYHLVYRLRRNDEKMDAWQEVPWNEQRRLLSAFWNPRKRLRKLELDATQAILSLYRDDPGFADGALVLTIPYLMLLNVACAHCSGERAEAIQFAIVQSYGFKSEKPAEVLIRSGLHSFDHV